MEFVRAHPEHDGIVVAHYLAIWESYGTAPDHLRSHPEEIVREFLKVGRGDYKLASFIAFDGEAAAGSVSCRLNTKAYPTVLKPEHSTEGYIWSVFTKDAYRGHGVARKLVTMAVDHLQAIGCTSVVLHSSEAGKPLYTGMGFELATEMRLKFDKMSNISPPHPA
ncbi:GNAT family N-acetyltransferase [Rhizobium leguminosarum]|uniref:GNAT family N-acetyltransferase n=1 Tax=Rhizobium leguminosarum TaxID=384 RepID=UPI001C96AAB8|nr:GNAT family N-acetyltransferase [Rhizobium leguminosarum]MBY5570659.1 GNAT family N-acetyltransferase [Rhizobium leguminosarum]MBY5577224.1 GNAT family N-acetyltransferase [Rhizobium leguminosarum]